VFIDSKPSFQGYRHEPISCCVLSDCQRHTRRVCEPSIAGNLRPYTAEESKQLALEALSRRGLSFDEYQQQRAALTGQPQKPFGFDRQGEMNAERNVVLHGRPS